VNGYIVVGKVVAIEGAAADLGHDPVVYGCEPLAALFRR
jgi:hypothetical protein